MKCTSCDRLAGSNLIECQECLDVVNRIRLLVLPTPLGDSKLSEKVEHDQRLSFNNIPTFVDKMNLDEHFVFMKKLEACAAACNLAYNHKMDKLRVSKEDINARISMQGSITKSARQAKIDQMPKKEKRLMTDRDKGIEQLMKIGLDRASAEKSIDEQMSKQGRLVKVD